VKTEKHSWAIDSIEEFVASVEVDGKLMARVPQWLLPPAAKEGDIVAVEHNISDDGAKSSVEIAFDREATKRAHERSARVPKKTGREKVDPGGDIKL
jgi:hypothetical protein